MIKFGVQLQQEEFNFSGMKKAWREVENLGFDSVWIYDHFYPMSQATSNYILEAWTFLSVLAEVTRKIRFGVLVTCNSYRFPPVLAKIASTVDVISGGRLEFGIGAGWHDEEYNAYGITFPSAKVRLEQLSEAIEIIKRIWTEEKATFKGKYYEIENLISNPKPIQKPHPPIWIGGRSNMALRIAAKHADYVNISGTSISGISERLKILEEYCDKMGRRYKDLEKTWFGQIIICDKYEEAKKKALTFKNHAANKSLREIDIKDFLNNHLIGTEDHCIEKLRNYIDKGITYFILHFPFAQDLQDQSIFIEEIASKII